MLYRKREGEFCFWTMMDVSIASKMNYDVQAQCPPIFLLRSNVIPASV